MNIQLRDYQQGCSDAMLNHMLAGKNGGLGVMATGCHATNHPILMYDGSIKLVQDVNVGDQIMGPDSSPRNVISLARGKEKMVEICPTKGEKFIVNESHILSLIATNEGKTHGTKKRGTEVTNIKVKDYLLKNKTFKHIHKLRRSHVNFSSYIPLPIEPWFLGVLLGDGGMINNISVTSEDYEILLATYRFCRDHNLSIRECNDDQKNSIDLFISGSGKPKGNWLRNELKKLRLHGTKSHNKFVPIIYKTSSEENRLSVIAGLIDTDGSLSGNGYDYISKSEVLADDLVFLCRSVGLAAYKKECVKSCGDFSATYYRVSISGDTHKIPVIVRKKKADYLLFLLLESIIDNYQDTYQENAELSAHKLNSTHIKPTPEFTSLVEKRKQELFNFKKATMSLKDTIVKLEKIEIENFNVKYFSELKEQTNNLVSNIDFELQELESKINLIFSINSYEKQHVKTLSNTPKSHKWFFKPSYEIKYTDINCIQKVKVIDLSNNQLDDECARFISGSIAKCEIKGLRELHIYGNKITKKGEKLIVKAMKTPAVKDLVVLTEKLDNSLKLSFGSKNQRIKEMKSLLQKAKNKGVDIDSIVVDKSFYTYI